MSCYILNVKANCTLFGLALLLCFRFCSLAHSVLFSCATVSTPTPFHPFHFPAPVNSFASFTIQLRTLSHLVSCAHLAFPLAKLSVLHTYIDFSYLILHSSFSSRSHITLCLCLRFLVSCLRIHIPTHILILVRVVLMIRGLGSPAAWLAVPLIFAVVGVIVHSAWSSRPSTFVISTRAEARAQMFLLAPPWWSSAFLGFGRSRICLLVFALVLPLSGCAPFPGAGWSSVHLA